MSSTQLSGFRMAIAGLSLFFLGLVLGFAVTIFPAIKPLLAAHQAALGSGTFLIASGAIWSIYLTSQARVLVPAICLSHYPLAATIALDGLSGAAHRIAGPLIGISCIAVTATTLLLIVQFRRVPSTTPGEA